MSKTAAAEVDLDAAMRKKRVAAVEKAAEHEAQDAGTSGKRKYTKRFNEIRSRPSIFINKIELAHHLQCTPPALRRMIADEELPPPFARVGAKHPVWLRSHFDEFVRTARWPRGAWEAPA